MGGPVSVNCAGFSAGGLNKATAIALKATVDPQFARGSLGTPPDELPRSHDLVLAILDGTLMARRGKHGYKHRN